MFLDFFYRLRDVGVPVSMQEWMMLMTALEKGQHSSSLMSFYNLARSCLVKSETYFDSFDRVFAEVFRGVEGQFVFAPAPVPAHQVDQQPVLALEVAVNGTFRGFERLGQFAEGELLGAQLIDQPNAVLHDPLSQIRAHRILQEHRFRHLYRYLHQSLHL